MPEWVAEWLWAGLIWLAVALVMGLIAGRFIRAGSGDAFRGRS